MKRSRALLLPPGMSWPRVLLDADTAATVKAARLLGEGLVKPGFACITSGAPAAARLHRMLALLPEPSGLHLLHAEPLSAQATVGALDARLKSFPARTGPPASNGPRLILAPGMGAVRADRQPLADWLADWAALASAGDLLAFTLPVWRNPALLEARWAQANPGARVFADPVAMTVSLTGDSGTVALTHLPRTGDAGFLAAHGFELAGLADGGGVLAVVARRA